MFDSTLIFTVCFIGICFISSCVCYIYCETHEYESDDKNEYPEEE